MDVLQESINKATSMAVANGHHVESTLMVNGFNGNSKEQEAIELTKNNQDESEEILSYPKKQSRGPNSIIVESSVPFKREEVTKWYGWGYKDSSFYFRDGNIRFSGDRYPICNRNLPYFKLWIKENYGIVLPECIDIESEAVEIPKNLPKSRITRKQLNALKKINLKMSLEGTDRIVRACGQTLNDVMRRRNQTVDRIPDLVIWPTCHEDVIQIVKICDANDIVIIPFGGGTSVSGAIACPLDESRTILSLDMCAMNEILWIDKESMVACCEAGIIGQDLERELQKVGYTVGHEPDSIEFSTLGGWVSTRASGMKKNEYGNIEDIMVHAKMVTPRGVLEKGNRVPRMSCGPDFNSVILGSEGCFGVITEVIIKIRPLPAYKRFGSLVFPDFESGVNCLREIALHRCQPASIRLMDNEQYQLGQAFRNSSSYLGKVVDGLKFFYLSKVKGYDLKSICVATMLFVGEKNEVLAHEAKINEIAAQYGGIPAGRSNGERGYNMTFVIAYLRDVSVELDIMAESLETSVPWDRVMKVIQCVKQRIAKECNNLGIRYYTTMCRVAQTYDVGCCIYFYFVIKSRDLEDPVKTTEYLEEIAKDEIVSLGGSISHHHGIGKLRTKWYESSVSPVGHNLFRVCKAQMDPNNIFASKNLSNDLEMKNYTL